MMLPMMLKAMSTTLRLLLPSRGRSLKVRPRSISLWSSSGDLMYLEMLYLEFELCVRSPKMHWQTHFVRMATSAG